MKVIEIFETSERNGEIRFYIRKIVSLFHQFQIKLNSNVDNTVSYWFNNNFRTYVDDTINKYHANNDITNDNIFDILNNVNHITDYINQYFGNYNNDTLFKEWNKYRTLLLVAVSKLRELYDDKLP